MRTSSQTQGACFNPKYNLTLHQRDSGAHHHTWHSRCFFKCRPQSKSCFSFRRKPGKHCEPA